MIKNISELINSVKVSSKTMLDACTDIAAVSEETSPLSQKLLMQYRVFLKVLLYKQTQQLRVLIG